MPDRSNLSRELADGERQGLFVSELSGIQKYYRLNRDYPLYAELRSIIYKTIGVVGQLRQALQKLPNVEQAYLFGSFAAGRQDAASDLDVLIIGTPDAFALESALRRLERRLGREINYVLLTPAEFRKRQRGRDPMLEHIWNSQRVGLLAS